ncbi:MAG TPA: NAD-dependent epimerase/dehydratase family protein, partial [Anaerolineales bacterium]
PKLWTLLQGVDVVYHLAARVSVLESLLYPRDYNNVNVGGTVALMEAMRDVGVRRVVLASSGAVYGDLGEQPLKESVIPNPRSPYAVSKLAAEYYVRTIGGLWGIDTVSLRIFNAYGPGQHLPASHPPVVPHYLKQAQRGGTMVAHGDGSQTRDYVYVDDVVSGMVAAATAPNIDGLVINLGSGKETSIRELIKCVQDVTGSNAEVIYNPKTSGGVSRLCADLTLAREKLNYRSSIGLAEGLRLTLKRDARFK